MNKVTHHGLRRIQGLIEYFDTEKDFCSLMLSEPDILTDFDKKFYSKKYEYTFSGFLYYDLLLDYFTRKVDKIPSIEAHIKAGIELDKFIGYKNTKFKEK